MNCDLTDALIHDCLDGELSPTTSLELESHLNTCALCAGKLSTVKELKNVAQKHLRPVPAPSRLISRIQSHIRHEAAHCSMPEITRKRRLLPLLSLGSVALILIVWGLSQPIWRPSEKSTPSPMAMAMVDDHIRYRLTEEVTTLKTENTRDIEQWFTDKLDISLTLPTFSSQDMILKGARQCYILDRHVALLFYESPHDRLSLFAMNGQGMDLASMNPTRIGQTDFVNETFKGYQIICWEKHGVLFALVADQKHENLTQLINNAYI